MMFASTPKANIRMKQSPTESGSVAMTETVLRRWSRKMKTTAAAISASSVSASLSVSMVSWTMSVRS